MVCVMFVSLGACHRAAAEAEATLSVCLLSAVKGVVPAVYATTALVSPPPPPSPSLRPTAVRTLPERHWNVTGGGTAVLEVGIHENYGW